MTVKEFKDYIQRMEELGICNDDTKMMLTFGDDCDRYIANISEASLFSSNGILLLNEDCMLREADVPVGSVDDVIVANQVYSVTLLISDLKTIGPIPIRGAMQWRIELPIDGTKYEILRITDSNNSRWCEFVNRETGNYVLEYGREDCIKNVTHFNILYIDK